MADAPEFISKNDYRDNYHTSFPEAIAQNQAVYEIQQHDNVVSPESIRYYSEPSQKADDHDKVILNWQGPPRRKCCGLPRRWVFIGVPIILVVIAAAVVGGVIGSRSKHDSEGDDTTPASESTTSNSNPNGTSVEQLNHTSRYPSIAVSRTSADGSLWLFHLDTENDGIHAYNTNPTNWKYRGPVEGLSNKPVMGNSLAATSWLDDDTPRLSLYRVSDTIPVNLFSGDIACKDGVTATLPDLCADGITMQDHEWGAPDISVNSRLYLARWGTSKTNATVTGAYSGLQFRGAYVTDGGTLCNFGYDNGGTIQPNCDRPGAWPGSTNPLSLDGDPVASMSDYWYDSSGKQWNNQWLSDEGKNAFPEITTTPKPSNFSLTGNAAICSIPKTDKVSKAMTRIFRLNSENVVMEFKIVPGTTEMTVVDHTEAPWPRADSQSDGIAALAWREDDGADEHVRVYFPSGGKIVEMVMDGEEWKLGDFKVQSGS